MYSIHMPRLIDIVCSSSQRHLLLTLQMLSQTCHKMNGMLSLWGCGEHVEMTCCVYVMCVRVLRA